MDLTTRVGRIEIEGVIGNSPGPRKSIREVEDLLETASPIVTFGSITPIKRMGNAEPRYYMDDDGFFTQNFIGLANPGIKELLTELPGLMKKVEASGKYDCESGGRPDRGFGGHG